jgi:hypothetical protein
MSFPSPSERLRMTQVGAQDDTMRMREAARLESLAYEVRVFLICAACSRSWLASFSSIEKMLYSS